MSPNTGKLAPASVSMRSIIALGANLPSDQGGPVETLERAVAMLAEAGVQIAACSQWYISPAWPAGAGPDFVNGAISVSGMWGEALLRLMQRIETALGRTRKAGRWDARVCDLDLLCTGQQVAPDAATWHRIATGPAEAQRPTLVLPHPLMHTRAFALVPMAEIAAEWRHPLLGKTVAEMFQDLPADDVAAVRPMTG